YMNGYSDPRLPYYFVANNAGNYSGIRGGLPASANKSDFINGDYSEINTDLHEDVVWMKASETYFLLAEGALNGWSMGGTAEDFYQAGIRLSFEENGAAGADAYIANSTAVPAGYIDPLNKYSVTTPPSTVTIAWNNGDGDDLKREKIITQKYIAMFPNGQEAWTEHRRTGYPKVILPVNNENSSVADDTIIRRLMYPEDEYNTNRDRIDAAVPALLGGADNCGTRLWWDVGN
ncbi:MAG: SusD/RagB family nutrient-binding outer membrane lipoprotein, partial [Alistipes sp.]|nr:SusD/RagB family nutrient-binding outer membrane lipoprotein [Alistipes sp.]